MKRVLISIEATDSNYLIEKQIPFLHKVLDVHPAVSFGLGSRPACAALMGGMLPVCMIPNCRHRDIRAKWANPWFLTQTQAITEKQLFLTSNGWMLEILFPWMDNDQRKHSIKWTSNHQVLPSTEMVNYLLTNIEDLDSYFVYFHVFESHWPWFHVDRDYNQEPTREDRYQAVLYADSLVKTIWDALEFEAELVVCSDHNEPPRTVSAAEDVPSAKTMLSFFGCNELAYQAEPWPYNTNSFAWRWWEQGQVRLSPSGWE